VRGSGEREQRESGVDKLETEVMTRAYEACSDRRYFAVTEVKKGRVCQIPQLGKHSGKRATEPATGITYGAAKRGDGSARSALRPTRRRMDASYAELVRRSVMAIPLLLAFAARAEEPSPRVRPLVGISASGSDSGFGLGAQLGIRVSSFLLRGALDFGGGTGPRGYISTTLRADWLHPITERTALITGIGVGSLVYGFIFDSPTADIGVLTPEIGVLFGQDRSLGRVFGGLTAFVPLGSVSHPRDSAGKAVSPPRAMLTLLLSL